MIHTNSRVGALAAGAAALLLAVLGARAELTDVVTADATRFSSMLASPMPERRVEAIQGLTHLKHWPAEPGLIRLLDDSSPAVRREALLALGRIGTGQCVPRLIALLDNPDWETRANALLALQRMTAQDLEPSRPPWEGWWNSAPLADKQRELIAVAGSRHTNSASAAGSDTVVSRGRRVHKRPASATPASFPERREALRALRHLADQSNEAALITLLSAPQKPPLDPDERVALCQALERVGSTNAIPILAAQRIDAAAWALAAVGQSCRSASLQAEQALLNFPPTLATFLALDRLHSTNVAHLIPTLVGHMAQITYRSHPDDVMNDELQPIQRVGVNLIRRSGQAPLLIDCVLAELEATMKPPVTNAPKPEIPAAWRPMLERMRSELKPGFVREDGTTTSQPIVAAAYLADDPKLAGRLLPLLKHPAFVPRVYVALALGRLRATEALGALTNIINEGYAFSDSTTLASGKHFDQSQTVRWRGFLCMALGRLGTDAARVALERYASDPQQPRDIRYSSVVGLRFIAAPESVPVLQAVAQKDLIWMVRDEADRAIEKIRVLTAEKNESNPPLGS